jgi:hypothetical protein
MKERIIGSLLIIIVFVVLYITTGGELSPSQEPLNQNTSPQTKFNF